jgi:hypothetical protein
MPCPLCRRLTTGKRKRASVWSAPLQQIAAGEHRAALEGARATVLARHTAAMRNPLERARWHGLCAILNLPLTPEAFAERLGRPAP